MVHRGHVRGQGEAIPGGVLGGRAYQVLAKWRESAPVVWVTIGSLFAWLFERGAVLGVVKSFMDKAQLVLMHHLREHQSRCPTHL